LLQNALDQTHPGRFDARQWRASVAERLEGSDIAAIQADAAPLLERPGEADLLTREDLETLLG